MNDRLVSVKLILLSSSFVAQLLRLQDLDSYQLKSILSLLSSMPRHEDAKQPKLLPLQSLEKNRRLAEAFS
jgi:hypothetical protein